MNDMTNGPLPEMSEGQAREWQAILASYKSKSLLTGDIPAWMPCVCRYTIHKPGGPEKMKSFVWRLSRIV